MSNSPDTIYNALKKAVAYTAGVVIMLWLLFKLSNVLLLILLAIVAALVINAPITWLQKKKVKRGWASAIVFGAILLVFVLLGWMIIPKISEQLTLLINNVPAYVAHLQSQLSALFKSYPEVAKQFESEGSMFSQWFPSVPKTIRSVGNFSLSLVGMILLLIIFFSMVVYMVIQPRPLLELYLSFFEMDNRDKATKALSKASVMLIGWIRANVIGGAIQAVLTTVFLNIMDVPGAMVWGALAFFSTLIPKIGFYMMVIPPILVALSVSPLTALWVTIFFLAMDEILGDFVMPKLRSKTMNIHPASIIILLIAMAAAFGVTGAIMATPVAAFIKAFYEEFYLTKFKDDPELDKRIDAILFRTHRVEKDSV